MELLTYKSGQAEYTYYMDKDGKCVVHGEYKRFHSNGKLWAHSSWCHGWCHGEYKRWTDRGKQAHHCFYIDGEEQPYVEMSEQEKLLFQIQHPGFRFLPTS